MNPILQQEDADRDRFIELKRELKKYVEQNGASSFGWARATLGQVDKVLGREKRLAFLKEAFGRVVESSKDLTGPEQYALCCWAKPMTQPGGGQVYSAEFWHDLTILKKVYQGQTQLPGLGL